MHKPTSSHEAAVKLILRYLKGTSNHGLCFQAGPIRVHAYSNADWTSKPDAGDPQAGITYTTVLMSALGVPKSNLQYLDQAQNLNIVP